MTDLDDDISLSTAKIKHQVDEAMENNVATLYDPNRQYHPQVRRTPAVPTDSDVCFKSKSHPGTKKWRSVVEVFANDRDGYPRWDDSIKDAVKHELKRRFVHRFLVSLNSSGDQVKIGDGAWYLADEDEILQKTKQRFLDFRKAKKVELPFAEKCFPPKSPEEKKMDDSPLLGPTHLAPVSLENPITSLYNARWDLDQVMKRLRKSLAMDLLEKLSNPIPLLSELLQMTQTLENDLRTALNTLFESSHDIVIETTSAANSLDWLDSSDASAPDNDDGFPMDFQWDRVLLPEDHNMKIPVQKDVTVIGSAEISRSAHSAGDKCDFDGRAALSPSPESPTPAPGSPHHVPFKVPSCTNTRPNCQRLDELSSHEIQLSTSFHRKGNGLGRFSVAAHQQQVDKKETRKRLVDQQPTMVVPLQNVQPTSGGEISPTTTTPVLSPTNDVDKSFTLDSSLKGITQKLKETNLAESATMSHLAVALDFESNREGAMAAIASVPLMGKVFAQVQGGNLLDGQLILRIICIEEIWTHFMKRKKKLFEETISLRDLATEKLVPGRNEIPFAINFPFPSWLPSSANVNAREDAGFKISYKVQVSYEKQKQIKAASEWCSLPVQSCPLGGKTTRVIWGPKTFNIRSMGFLRKGCVSLAIWLDDEHIGPGCKLELSMSCLNHSAVDIQRVHVKVLEHIHLYADPQDTHPIHTNKIVLFEDENAILPGLERLKLHRSEVAQPSEHQQRESKDYQQTVDEGKTGLGRLCLTIPQESRTSFQGKLVAICHVIKVKLITSFSTETFSAMIPLRIECRPKSQCLQPTTSPLEYFLLGET